MSDDLKKSNIIYAYNCNIGECELLPDARYIGETVTTLSRRLTMHLQAGAILMHTKNKHNTQLTRDMLVSNTKIQHQVDNFDRLIIMEALLIHKENPKINRQHTGIIRTLNLFNNK